MEGTAVATRFDPAQAVASADAVVQRRRDELEQQIAEEANVARDAAREYAEHLAADGDPVKTPDAGDRYEARSTLITKRLAFVAVYRVWNEARGSRNLIIPIGNGPGWRVAEALFASFGQPVQYAELKKVGTGGYGTGMSTNDVNGLLRQIADYSKAQIVPRKTRVDGKVAYYIRDRREGDRDDYDDREREAWRPLGEGWSRDIPEEKP